MGRRDALLDTADLRIINLECAITDYERPWTRTPKVFHFRAQPSAVETLRTARIDACSLANNHTLDFEEQGRSIPWNTWTRPAFGTLERVATEMRPQNRPSLPCQRTTRAGGAAGVHGQRATFAAGIDRPGTNYLPVSLTPDVLRR